MTRYFALFGLAAVMCAAVVAPTSAQTRPSPQQPLPVAHVEATSWSDLQGVVHDDDGQPLAGAVVSALGTVSVFAVSDTTGRFAFHNLPKGP